MYGEKMLDEMSQASKRLARLVALLKLAEKGQDVRVTISDERYDPDSRSKASYRVLVADIGLDVVMPFLQREEALLEAKLAKLQERADEVKAAMADLRADL